MPVNLGNILMRRAFVGDNEELRERRMARFREVLNVKWSTAYKYLEEVGAFGSGRPSPLYKLCQLIELCHEFDVADRAPVSYARELAEYPMRYFRALTGATAAAVASGFDAFQRMSFLLKSASDANYVLKGRDFEGLSPGELKTIRRHLHDAMAAARDLEAQVAARLGEVEASFPGAPVLREHAAKAP